MASPVNFPALPPQSLCHHFHLIPSPIHRKRYPGRPVSRAPLHHRQRDSLQKDRHILCALSPPNRAKLRDVGAQGAFVRCGLRTMRLLSLIVCQQRKHIALFAALSLSLSRRPRRFSYRALLDASMVFRRRIGVTRRHRWNRRLQRSPSRRCRSRLAFPGANRHRRPSILLHFPQDGHNQQTAECSGGSTDGNTYPRAWCPHVGRAVGCRRPNQVPGSAR